MRLAAALLIVLGGCRSSDTHPTGSAQVVAYEGTRLAPDVAVISHRPTGEVVATTTTDAVGEATVATEDHSLISVLFSGGRASLVTTLQPPTGQVLEVHGPDRTMPPVLVVGVLSLAAPALAGATYYDIDVGCVTLRRTQFPTSIDITSCSEGSDLNLDVLVRGYHDIGGDPPAPVLDGYAAAHIPVVDGIAVFDIPGWQTAGAPVSLVFEGVTPTSVWWTQYADGNEYVSEQITPTTFAYTDLAVDTTLVEVVLPGSNVASFVDRSVAGVPATLTFGATDFLPVLDRTTTNDGTTFAWDPPAFTADAVNLHVFFDSTTWDVVLPPDANTVTLPEVIDVAPVTSVDVLLRYLDSSELADFAEVHAAGLHAEETLRTSTIVPRPSTGQVRITHAIGLR